MTRAFITGVGGQDGGYLAERLVSEGVDVHALAHEDDPTGRVDGVELHTGDLTRTDEVRRLLVDLAPDEVYNLAAVSSVARSWAEPDLTARVNGLAAVELLESALQAQERSGHPVRFVQASSAEIFGEAERTPQDESTPIRPTNPYGAAKAFAHLAVEVYRRRGLHAVSTILYNHESPRRPAHFVTRKISSGVAAIAAGQADMLQLGNLDARRDWGWAPDHVDAMIRAARADEGDDYVVATGVGHTVRDFVSAAFDRIGIQDWDPFVRTDPALLRATDSPALIGDPSRIRERLGWQPTVTFEELVGKMVDSDLAALRAEPDRTG